VYAEKRLQRMIAAAVFLYKYMRMCKADTIQIKVSFYTYTTVKPVAGGGERKRFQ
jgi:hypothetical protein